eukprot:SAG31_NODE_29969_length_387_cov_0.718750_1_plen_47_part_10
MHDCFCFTASQVAVLDEIQMLADPSRGWVLVLFCAYYSDGDLKYVFL